MKSLRVLPVILSIAVIFSSEASAFTCFLTLAKDSCWTEYDVKVDVIDILTNKTVISAIAPTGKSWNRQEFACQPGQTFKYIATFSPIFWESDKGKQYSGTRTWTLPKEIKKGDTAWNITVCYPEQFAEVPFPPTAKGNCVCDARKIPPVVAPKNPS